MPKIISSTSDVQDMADKAAAKADQAIDASLEQAHSALNGLSNLSHDASQALSRAAGQVEDLTRRTLDRARQAGSQVRDQVGRAGDATVGYIKDEPVKAVLIAAAAGAVAAGLYSWLTSRNDRR